MDQLFFLTSPPFPFLPFFFLFFVFPFLFPFSSLFFFSFLPSSLFFPFLFFFFFYFPFLFFFFPPYLFVFFFIFFFISFPFLILTLPFPLASNTHLLFSQFLFLFLLPQCLRIYVLFVCSPPQFGSDADNATNLICVPQFFDLELFAEHRMQKVCL